MQVKYAKYLERQEKEVARMRANAHTPIPAGFDFGAVPCLSTEEIEKLTRENVELKRKIEEDEGVAPELTRKKELHNNEEIAHRKLFFFNIEPIDQ